VFAGSGVGCAVGREFVCDTDSGLARQQRDELLGSGYRGGRFRESSLIAGSPSECLDRLSEVAALGLDDILMRPAVEGRAAVDRCLLPIDQRRSLASGCPSDRS
jgi:alkanesulfonate monooxygenase SsuD/methylene tetrahydromethanopterin reductase-like flavin-dependent oxidoreductase (luciferase family)